MGQLTRAQAHQIMRLNRPRTIVWAAEWPRQGVSFALVGPALAVALVVALAVLR